MENASKALIIAGAILLSILLISLGIMIFNQAQDTVTNSGMTEAELTAFNNKFLKYEGTQKGTMVKSMMQDVMANNANASDNHKVNVYLGNETDPLTDTSRILTKKSYTVKMQYGDDNAGNRITQIKITQIGN